jgi:hypothetical protein
MPRLLPPVLLLALAVLGCERPLVGLDPVGVVTTTPDLGLVQTQDVVPLQIRVSDGNAVEQLTVDGRPATRGAEPDVFLDTLRLAVGLNAFVVAVHDDRDNVTEDTLFAVYLPYASAPAPPLPEPRYEHTATALTDGRALVAGGFVGGQATGSAILVQESDGLVTYEPLASALRHPRAGHTATVLPDGRVLVLGGATRDPATEAADFVSQPELFDPATELFAEVPQSGAPLRRYDHAAVALEDDGRVFVYVYGGLEPGVVGAAVAGTFVVFELREEGGAPSLAEVSPPGGVGGPAPAHGHALLPLPSAGGAQRALAAAAALEGGAPVPFAQRLSFFPSVVFFPFEIATERVEAPETALAQFGAAPLSPGLFLFGGGGPLVAGTPDVPATDTLRVYADAAGRFFTFPDAVRLGVARSRHAATSLPSGRILLLGGVGAATLPEPLDQAEVIGLN